MDRYQRIKKIGEGAFGKAVLVRNKQTNRQCVVKEINIVKMGPREREEARKEVAVLAQLKHPNIVTYIESFEESGTLYIVMNYCAGGDLYARISTQQGRMFSEDQILTWFVQICLALKHIHDRKILHRDIKSQNIFLTSGGTVQLGDFGIAKVLNNTVELARTCIGTPYYLSPEIVENKPYNNKSDIWSLGCVLYELTTLKHAFEAGNMKNLVLKIIRGSYPPIPPTYSYDLRGLIAQMFKRAPRDRPSINSILRKNFIMERVRKVTSEEVIAAEFSHTVLHGAKIQKQLPPAAKALPSPRPSSAPKRSVTPRPNSAGRGRYNPANIYAAPLVGRKSQNNRSSDDKKKGGGNVGGSGGARPLPVPGQMEWQQKKKDLLEREQRRRDEEKKKWEEQMGRRHQNLVEKQKMDRINKAREDGWKNLANLPDNLNQQSPRRNGDARPLPVPNPKPEVGNMPNFDNRLRERGNYDNYMAYLDQLKANRLAQEKQMKAGANYTPAPRPLVVDPKTPAPVQAAMAINQANHDRQMGADAAERARLVEEYQQRRQAAARNKARGLADLYGRPPSGHRTPTPVQRPAPVRNKAEQEYLEKLRQIREQNMREHRDILRQKAGIPPEDKDPESAARKEKANALKQQAEDWAKKKKGLQDPQQDKTPNGRPDCVRNLTPAPAVPVSGVLHLIGAGDKAGLPTPGSTEPEPANEDSAKGVQQKKVGILKRLNEKSAAQGKGRGQWGSDKAASPAMAEDEVQLRRPWGGKCGTPVAQDPDAARQQWSDEQLRLSVLPLEHTASEMEATSDADKVERFHPLPGQTSKAEETPKLVRNQWGRPGSSLVRALNQLPVIEGTVILDTDVSGGNVEAAKAAVAPKPAISYTISLQSPSPSPTPPLAPSTSATPRPLPTPSVHPPVRSGTIVLKPADTPAAASGTAPPPVSPELFGVMAGKVFENESRTSSEPPLATAVILESELPASNRCLQANNPQQANIFQHSDLVTVDERSEKSDEREESQDDSGIEASVCSPDKADEQNFEQDQKTSESGNGTSVRPNTETLITEGSQDGVPKSNFKSQIAVTPTLWPEETTAQPTAATGQEDGDGRKSSDSVAASDDSDDSEGQAVKKGLCTGNFDMQDVKMLRTCSEPDMTKFFRELESRMTRHGSMELKKDGDASVQKEMSPVDNSSQGVEGNSSSLEVAMEEVPMEDEVPVEEEDDEDLISLRATMQSLLCEDDVPVDDGSSDDEDDELKCLQDTMMGILSDDSGASAIPTVKFKTPGDAEKTLKNGDAGDGAEGEQVEENKAEKDEENKGEKSLMEEDHLLAVPDQLKVRCQSDSALALHHMQLLKEEGKAAEEESKMMEEEDEEESEEEELRYCTADILALGEGHDSDEETIFGDEDNDDLDLFSRLEQQRTDLENELGMDKFIEVYKTVQALQEDEDEKMEEGMNIALQLLGKEKEHLYHKIFNLVLADTAFTEDNT